MIKQIVKSEEELIKLIKKEVKSRSLSNNQHGSDKDELNLAVDSFLEQYPIKKYPVLVFAKFNFRYKGFDYDLDEMVYILEKKDAVSMLETLNNA